MAIIVSDTEDCQITACKTVSDVWIIGPWEIWTVREITKSRSTFYATNISSNIVWLLQLHDAIQMKSNYLRINYNHDNIAIRNHITIYDFVWNFIFDTKFSRFYLAKGEKGLVFRLSFVNLQRVKDGNHMFGYHTSLIDFPNESSPCIKKMRLNLVTKMKFYTSIYIIKWLLMAMM